MRTYVIFGAKEANMSILTDPHNTHGGNLDWYLCAKEVSLNEAKGQPIPGTDHVAVVTILGGGAEPDPRVSDGGPGGV